MMTNRKAALAQLDLAAKQGPMDTRVLTVHVQTALVYALLAIADAIEDAR